MQSLISHIGFLEKEGPVTAIYTHKPLCGFDRMDGPSAVNFEKVCRAVGCEEGCAVRIEQTHSTGVRKITLSDAGEGIYRENTITGCDAMITNERGILLCTVEADCVPVYLFDPVKNAVAMIHSGWRGTAGEITAEAIKRMKSEYNCNPADIFAAIGPHICSGCYEVGKELVLEFSEKYSLREIESIFKDKGNGKKLLNLSEAIRFTCQRNGITEEHFFDVMCCSYENTGICSWRRDQKRKERMLTGIFLK